MRREIPAGVAVAVIIVALVVAAGVMCFLMNRPSGGGGTPPLRSSCPSHHMQGKGQSLHRRRSERAKSFR